MQGCSTIIPLARMGSSQYSMKLKAEWAIDSEPIRARGLIFLVRPS